MKGNRRHKFWSFGRLRWRNFSALLSLLPLLIAGFLAVVTEGKVEARSKTRYSEECCVVAQTFPPGYEYGVPFPDRFSDRTYEVFVPTYSTDLLNFVQTRIDNSARFAHRGQRAVITLGRYDLNGARRRVRQLMGLGITAEMVAINRFSDNSVLPLENSRYVVFVSVRRRSDLEDALWRIQPIVPQASVWQYRGRNVILVGQFPNQSEALEFRNELRSQGIWADYARNPIRPIIQPISSNETNYVVSENPNPDRFVAWENPGQKNDTYTANNSYNVIISARQEELAGIEAQVRQMAIDLGRENEVLVQYAPNRSQLIVGPFPQLESAQEWQGYLQDYGINNARVINSN